MEDLILVILQFLFEFLLEIFSNLPFDWPLSRKDGWEAANLTGKCLTFFLLGCGLAIISMLVFKRTWISHPALQILNLVLAPIISAFISQAIARRRSRRHPDVIPRDHFWQAFWFTLGLVFVRFAYAVRH